MGYKVAYSGVLEKPITLHAMIITRMKVLSILIVFVVMLLPVSVDAALVPVQCADPQMCGSCEFVSLINNVIQFIVQIASLLAVIVFIYAGFLMVTSQGNPSQLTKAKGLFANVVIGLVILLAAFLIVNTILSGLAGTGSPILSWQQIECVYPAGVNKPTAYNGGLSSGGIGVIGGSYGGGGSCTVSTSGNCSVSNLSCFGSDAESASKICNLESSGGNASAKSATDLCKDGASFSGGLFQINILANNSYLNSCSTDFYTKNGSGAQGTCLDYRTNSNGTGYCAVRDCQITNYVVYGNCMEETYNSNNNIQIACQLYNGSGQDFDPWITSATVCGAT